MHTVFIFAFDMIFWDEQFTYKLIKRKKDFIRLAMDGA